MTDNFSISRFKDEVSAEGDFTSAHFFEAQVAFDDVTLAVLNEAQQRNLRKFFLCKSLKLPGQTIDHNVLSYFGRAVKIPGARSYEPIALEFFHTNNYSMLELFQEWQGILASHDGNRMGVHEHVRKHGEGPSTIQSLRKPVYGTITLNHYSNEGTGSKLIATTPLLNLFSKSKHKLAATYVLHGAFPTAISGLSFSYDESETVQQYGVTFEYQAMSYISVHRSIDRPTKSEPAPSAAPAVPVEPAHH